MGDHRDLNAHNVLFTERGLYLIDWDAAGPAKSQTEKAIASMLWSQQQGGTYDSRRTASFLTGYRNAGGEVSSKDPEHLIAWLDGLVWWTYDNVRMAVENPSDGQHAAVQQLLLDSLKSEETVRERIEFLADVISGLDHGLTAD